MLAPTTRRSDRTRRASWLCVLLSGVLGAPLAAQFPDRERFRRFREVGRLALEQALRDASSDTLVLIVAAHPDDRWPLPAAYLRFEYGMRVAVLLFTRGEGGQNSSGPETGDALGRLRTIEAENSADRLGVKVHYLNRPDSGYSRSAQETLDEWNEAKTVRDLARMIRGIQPDIVLTAHHAEETHGHDGALLKILPQAVAASADPGFATPGLPPFVVSRLFRGAAPKEEDSASVSLMMDRDDENRGRTYREIAYRALQEHRTQAPLQEIDDLLPPILDLVPVPIGDQPLHRTLLNQLPDLFRSLHEAIPNFDSQDLRNRFGGLRTHLTSLPELSTAAIELQRRLRAIPAPPGTELDRRLRRRMAALDRIILHSAKVRVKLPLDAEAAPGEDLPLQIWIGNDGHHTVTGIRVTALNDGRLEVLSPRTEHTRLESEESVVLEAQYRPPDLTEEDLAALFTRETFEEPLRLRFQFEIDGLPMTVEKVFQFAPEPAVKLTVMPQNLLIPSGVDRVPFVVAVERRPSRAIDLQLRIRAPAGTRVDSGVQQLLLPAKERYRELTFVLGCNNLRPGAGAMFVYAGTHRTRVNVSRVDVRVVPDLRVGLVPGVDNTSHEILEALIGKSRLEVFERDRTLPILDRRVQTIVVDVRALRSHKARSGFARLLEYVKDGGRLVVFYHKDVEFNRSTAFFTGAPYPLEIGKGRVTRQDAPVRILVPDHPIFNHPNKILSADWDEWRQERGLYFPGRYDAGHYQELLEMNDPGLPAERGALLYARYGKGEYIYCALSLYRQLKNRHPGACRLFANLISPPPKG